jgi:hypothetical protein
MMLLSLLAHAPLLFTLFRMWALQQQGVITRY